MDATIWGSSLRELERFRFAFFILFFLLFLVFVTSEFLGNCLENHALYLTGVVGRKIGVVDFVAARTQAQYGYRGDDERHSQPVVAADMTNQHQTDTGHYHGCKTQRSKSVVPIFSGGKEKSGQKSTCRYGGCDLNISRSSVPSSLDGVFLIRLSVILFLTMNVIYINSIL